MKKGEIIRSNEANLFRDKEDLGEFNDFEKVLNEHPKIKTARDVLQYRKHSKGLLSDEETEKLIGKEEFKKLEAAKSKANNQLQLSQFNKNLQTALNYNPKNKE